MKCTYFPVVDPVQESICPPHQMVRGKSWKERRLHSFGRQGSEALFWVVVFFWARQNILII